MLVHGIPMLNLIDPFHGISSYGVLTPHIIEPPLGIWQYTEALCSTLRTPLLEYNSSWSPYAQLYRTLSWSMLVHGLPTLNFIDTSHGIC